MSLRYVRTYKGVYKTGFCRSRHIKWLKFFSNCTWTTTLNSTGVIFKFVVYFIFYCAFRELFYKDGANLDSIGTLLINYKNKLMLYYFKNQALHQLHISNIITQHVWYFSIATQRLFSNKIICNHAIMLSGIEFETNPFKPKTMQRIVFFTVL